MPQVVFVLDKECPAEGNPLVPLEEAVKRLVKQRLCADEVAVTWHRALRTENEADVQMEVRYTEGRPNDPPPICLHFLSAEEKEALAEAMLDTARGFLPYMSASVWVIPLPGALFRSQKASARD